MRQISGGSPLRWAAPALLAASMPLVMHGLVQVVGSAPDPTEAGVVVGTMAWAAMPFVALAALALFTRHELQRKIEHYHRRISNVGFADILAS